MIFYKYNYVGLHGNPETIQDQDLPRPCGACRLTWTGVCYRDHAGLVALPGQACVTETLRVLSPYLDRTVCCMRCCSSWSQGTGCRRAVGPGCRRRGSGTCCRLHRSDCTSPTLPRSPMHRALKHNCLLSLPSSPFQHSALSVLYGVSVYLLKHTCWLKPRHPQTP